MKNVIRQSYDVVKAPSPFKEDLLNTLLESRGSITDRMGNRFWGKPGFLASVYAVIVVTIIVYGIWLPSSIEI